MAGEEAGTERGEPPATEAAFQTYRTRYISVLLGSVGLIVAGSLFLIRNMPHLPTLVGENGVWEIFFAVFGLVYAIIVGLFVVEAHRRLRELSSLIQNESNAADDIIDFLQYFGEDKQKNTVDNIKGRLGEFANSLTLDLGLKEDQYHGLSRWKAIIFDDWAMIVESVKSIARGAWRMILFTVSLIPGVDLNPRCKKNRKYGQRWRRAIQEMIRDVGSLEPGPAASKSALDGLVRKIADLTTYRSEAMQVAKRGFPIPFYILLIIMPMAVLVGFALIDVANPHLQEFLFTAVAITMWLLLALVWDLDHPRKAFWNIQDEVTDYVGELNVRI